MESGVEAQAASSRLAAPFGEDAAAFPARTWADPFAQSNIAPNTGFPEIDCVRARFTPAVIEAAESRAAMLGVGADRVLIAAGRISEDDYLLALADTLGMAFEPLDGAPRILCPLNDERLIESAAAGLLPLTIDAQLYLVIAPRGTAARRIIRLIEEKPGLATRFRFTSAARLNRYVLHHGGRAIAARATTDLQQAWPMLCAGPPRWRTNVVPAAGCALLTLAAAVAAPAGTMLVLEAMLAAIFLAWLALRLSGVFIRPSASDQTSGIADGMLPVYTIVAALYREAASIDGLLTAIERLDYPAEKLELILAVEADDRETRSAIAARKGRLAITVIPVPVSGPRTKPKALNAALPFVRGTFTVIYDAEDRPEPSQLRRALQAFRSGGGELACVQARLCIDNTADSWLARLFTAEYAGQFDVFLPGLAALRLPLPLGGSSNHFHTRTLRAVHGWDPFNVTEDADLGTRLARFGYRSDVIASTTYEEAPAQLGAWLRQRTRWFKGWMQTWAVHMREPRALMRDLGLYGFLTFQLVVGGNALAALVHPLFMASFIYSLVNGLPPWRGNDATVEVLATLYGTSIAVGYLTSAFLAWLGLSRRGLLATAWVLLLTPLHWLLLSLAAWRALFQLVVSPYTWEKTEHGLAKSSRLAASMVRSLLGLERFLSKLKDSGQLPPQADRARSISAARRTRRRAA